jgi:hypothetical protein
MWLLLGGFTMGPISGLALFVLLARNIRVRAYDVCAARARVEYGSRPAVADGFNSGEAPSRRRSPDYQLVTTDFPKFVPRPVLHDPPR